MLLLNGVLRGKRPGRDDKLVPLPRARCILYVVKNGSSIHFARMTAGIAFGRSAMIVYCPYLLIGSLRPENLSLMRSAASENSPAGFSTQ